MLLTGTASRRLVGASVLLALWGLGCGSGRETATETQSRAETAALPDLVVTVVKAPTSAIPGSPFTAAVTVCNRGTAPGGAQVDLVLSADPNIHAPVPPLPWEPWDPAGDRLVGGDFFQVGPGACETRNVQGIADAPGVDGAYYVGAIADLPNMLPELIETNNASRGSLIGIGWGPDLVVTAVKGPPSATPGSPFTAAVTVCNQGTAPGGAKVDLVLSADSTIEVPLPPEPWDPAADRMVGGDLFQLQPGACETRSVQGIADAPGAEGAYRLGAVADVANALPELIETNNASRGSLIGIGWEPDLVVTAVKGPPSVTPGSPFTAAVTVCNQGTAPGGAPVDLVLSADATIDVPVPPEPWDPTADRLVGGDFFQLPPGACETRGLQGIADAPGVDGPYYLGAIADLPNMLPELIEINNANRGSLVGIGWGPDLVVTAVKGPPSATPGSSFSAALTVCNHGTAPGGAQVDLVLSADASIEASVAPWWDPTADRPVGGGFFQLEPGACETRNVQGIAIPPGVDGAYYLGAIADPPNMLPELIETNNASRGTLIGIGFGPDLVITAVKGPPSVAPGSPFTAAVTVCNQGTAPGGAQVDLVLSADSTIDVAGPPAPWDPAADRPVGGAFFQPQPGACETRNVQGIADAPGVDGAYYLGAVADLPNALPELIETNNNSRGSLIGIGSGPDFVITAVKGPPSVMRGRSFTASVTVCNQGTAPGSAPVDLVLSADSSIEVAVPPAPWDPSSDRPVGGSYFELEAGACESRSVQGFADPPGPGGAYYLGAVADLPNVLPELIEINNTRSGARISITE
jgi:large repetitive protein